ncbi:MAG: hypothetical protein ACLP19_18165 [Xanthobacteraceae bacterium]
MSEATASPWGREWQSQLEGVRGQPEPTKFINVHNELYVANTSGVGPFGPPRVIPIDESDKTMADLTREEMKAEIALSEAHADTKIARMEGKLDLVLSKLDGLNVRFEDARNDAREARTTAHSDNVTTRANIWVVGLGLAVLIVAVAALLPVFFSIGAQVRDLVHNEIQSQTPHQ